MNSSEPIWEEFVEQISKLKVLKNIVEHSAEIQVNNYTKLQLTHNPDIKRYHNGINFIKHNYADNKPSVVCIETKSFNIIEYIELIKEQHNEQYKLILAKAYESFKKFIKNIFENNNENEIAILIKNKYIEVHHDTFDINLFYIINIIRVMRNKISHNDNINNGIIVQDIEKKGVRHLNGNFS